ncbi:hypothetical protein Vafri_19047, partial [Volvox africanus]
PPPASSSLPNDPLSPALRTQIHNGSKTLPTNHNHLQRFLRICRQNAVASTGLKYKVAAASKTQTFPSAAAAPSAAATGTLAGRRHRLRPPLLLLLLLSPPLLLLLLLLLFLCPLGG